MSKIDRLTPDQQARFSDFVREWTAVGLSTEPADRPRAEAAIKWMYREAELAEPRTVWCGSPRSDALTRDSVWDSVWDSVRASVRASVWASVGDSVWASVWASVGDSVWARVGASVGDSVGASVWASVGDSVGDSVHGQHEAPWLAFYAFFREACGLTKQTDPLQGLFELSRSAGWLLPHRNICWVSERHNVLNRDDRGRLHCADGPALQYPDGWGIWAWHGVRVPEAVIKREFDAAAVTSERNAEIRRAMVEIMGAEAYVKGAGLTIAHQDQWGILRREPGGEFGIVELENHSLEPDGSRKRYHLMVPPDCQTALEAVAWTFDLPPEQYAQMRASS